MMPTITSRIGTETHTSQDSPTSSCTAMMIPPTDMIGTITMKFSAISTTIWTCWTSLVPRVIRVGAPKRPTSSAENRSTREYTERRMSRPMAMDTRAPNQTAEIAAITWTRATPSITAPVRQMKSVSPTATPWSMMPAFRLGRYSVARVETSCSTSTAMMWPV